jgi:hypothetical protein
MAMIYLAGWAVMVTPARIGLWPGVHNLGCRLYLGFAGRLRQTFAGRLRQTFDGHSAT